MNEQSIMHLTSNTNHRKKVQLVNQMAPKNDMLSLKPKKKFEKQPAVVDGELPGSNEEEIVEQEVVDDDILMMFKGMPVRKKEMPNFSIKELLIPKAERKRPYDTHERLSLDREDLQTCAQYDRERIK